MTVDHFRPQSRYPQLALAWENLYYACTVCNSHYKKDHPTLEEELAGCQFVDPCAEDPVHHFRMTRDTKTKRLCVVRPLTSPASYTVRRLQLNRRKSLRDFWTEIEQGEQRELKFLEQLSRMREDLRAELAHHKTPQRLKTVLAACEKLLMERQHCLQEIRDQIPFPLDESVLPVSAGKQRTDTSARKKASSKRQAAPRQSARRNR